MTPRYKTLTQLQPGVLAEFPSYTFRRVKERGGFQIVRFWPSGKFRYFVNPQDYTFDKCGNIQVCLKNNHNQSVRETLKKCVAYAYMTNTENHPFIRHKDGNKMNTSADNLEFTSMRVDGKRYSSKVSKQNC